jgi:two-component system, LytTR family, sensor kinase
MSDPPASSRPVPWLWITAIWLGVGLIDASQTVFPMRAQGMHHNWTRLFTVSVLNWLPWLLATPVLMRTGRAYPLSWPPAREAVAIHAGLILIVSFATAAWSALLEVLLDPWAQTQPVGSYADVWSAKLSYGILTSLIVYAFIQVVTYAVESADRVARQRTDAAQLNEQLAKAQLDALRQQIDPHFMFNTLNAISGLVRDQRNHAAVSMIVGLSELLRRTATDNHRPQVALEDEIEYLQRFLDIQKIRFGERLNVIVDIPSDLYPELVPNFFLQPLVENAIQHGIAKRVEGGTIRITGRRAGDVLHLTVHNDGPRLPSDEGTVRAGIGLSNLRTRLQILYGGRFELELRHPETAGVEAVVSLPIGRG